MTQSEADQAQNGVTPWARLTGSAKRDEYLEAWLTLLCAQVPGALQGVLVLRDGEGVPYKPVAHWPPDRGYPAELTELCEAVLNQKSGLAVALEAASTPEREVFGLGYPITVEDELCGVVAVQVHAVTGDTIRSGMEQLQWGAAGAEVALRRSRAGDEVAAQERLRHAVDLFTTVLAEDRYHAAAMAFVTTLASHLKCDRVSLGMMRGEHVQLLAMSHSIEFSKRMKLNRALIGAMEESIVQRADVIYPQPAGRDPWITREHEALSSSYGAGSILTVPTYGKGRFAGSLTLERAASEPFSDADVRLVRAVSTLVMPVLEEKRLNDRWIVTKNVEWVAKQIGRVIGPGYLGRKLAVLALIGVVAFFRTAEIDYRLTANTVIEGSIRRALVSPFDGYLNAAYHRAGDTVKKGELICQLEDREIRIERLKNVSQQTQLERQYQESMAGGRDKAKAGVIEAQIGQVKAQLELVESQLERTRMTAPFDGLVVSGDLSQRLGSAVKQGEVLFEIAPLESYRVILKVDERRITEVKEGQKGQLVLSALPHEKFEFVIEKITPVSTPQEGRNYFRVEAKLDHSSPSLRPGMEGVGKVSIDRRKLIAVWTRDIVDWGRQWLWTWLP